MAEEKPLFLVDIDRAIEGLLSSMPKRTAEPPKAEAIIIHCIDLANALDGAGLEDLSGFAQELANQIKESKPQSFLLVNDFIALTNAGVALIHPADSSHEDVSSTLLQEAKSSFAKKLEQLKVGAPISQESILVNLAPQQVEDRVRTEEQVADETVLSMNEKVSSVDDVIEDAFPNQEFSSELFQGLQSKKSSADEVQNDVDALAQARISNHDVPVSREQALEQTLDRAVNELSQLFAPRKESPPVLFTPPEPKPFSLPESLAKPIDRDSSFEYSSRARYLDKHFTLDRVSNLNRMQKARSLVGKVDSWSGAEVDFLLGREQDELVRSGQQSLRHIFENLTDELLIDEVYADPDIAQQLLTILSILPPCPSIFAVQQELMIFIDLDHVTLSNEHLLAVSSMMAEIGGSLEVHYDGVRLSCPSSLLRMPMAYFTRHGEQYAVSAIQYLGEEPLTKAVESTIDFLGEIIHPARSIFIRVGNQDYMIHAHEFLGVQNMNVHQNLPSSLERPYWMAGVALDGANNVYSWIALDRHSR
ncbi:hypothetical protein [Polynucleobacter sp. MWH-UH35A]|uniref:hypothetical protein n=1 Tax=Polynucleobacter sp. MWH-UH35A TaxID=1855619 RepID=UPI001BFDF942|nr:hypothetical protein [Polynucleobacter sp. MWH-UH35A]QWD59765.1 hypothetical protein ICV36_08160 [Polynucleobacter sp. MWH-UH35A]